MPPSTSTRSGSFSFSSSARVKRRRITSAIDAGSSAPATVWIRYVRYRDGVGIPPTDTTRLATEFVPEMFEMS